MVAVFNGNSGTKIICSSRTNVNDELSSLVNSSPKHNVLIIGEDMNAKKGKNVNYKFNLHNSSNRNGENLTDFTLENRLTCLNIKFPKRKGKLWTYTNVNNAKSQIDYILVNRKWINGAWNCEACSSFEDVSSNHRIVMAKIRQSPNVARTTTTVYYDWSLLNNRDIRYTLTLRNKSDALQEISETPILNNNY